ncbi:MAG: sodium:proton antiporter [Acidobacteriota bacterium]
MKKILTIISLLLVIPIFSFSSQKTEIIPISPFWSIPFILLLISIAVFPLINKEWWDKNFQYFSLFLGFIVVSYYLFFHNPPRVWGIFLEYFSFISLIGSLFVVSGGILIRTERKTTPFLNVLILFIGSVISNLFGTTGASMILIRPFLRINRYRIKPYHVVFFIFLVSNIGGCLTPVGDPPLFLGYLEGVPFFWVIEHVWQIWLLTIILVLTIFFLIDYYHYSKLSKEAHPKKKVKFEILGLHNLLFIVLILTAVFTHTPFREIIMITSAIISYKFTNKEIHKENEFNFFPIEEVAILFAGLFATMIPALDWLRLNGGKLGITVPGAFFWATGTFSSFLDNAPTYLNFLSAAIGFKGMEVKNLLIHFPEYVVAISVAAVFFGAMTYIGNAPNFMVKSISEHQKINCPSFLEYMIKYSIPLLIPIFFSIWLLFFL